MEFKRAGVVKWYNCGLQNRDWGFDSLHPCHHVKGGFVEDHLDKGDFFVGDENQIVCYNQTRVSYLSKQGGMLWKTLKSAYKSKILVILISIIFALGYYWFSNWQSQNTINSSKAVNSIFTNQDEQSTGYTTGKISELGSNFVVLELMDKSKIRFSIDNQTKFQETRVENGSKFFVVNNQLNIASLKQDQRISIVLAKDETELVAREINIE